MYLEWLIVTRYIRGVVPAALFSAKSKVSFLVMVTAIALLVIVLSIFNGFQVNMKNSLWGQGAHITLTPQYGAVHKKLKQTTQDILNLPLYDDPRPGEDEDDIPKIKDKVKTVYGGIISPGLFVQGADFVPIEVRAIEYRPNNEGFPGPEYPRITQYDRRFLENFQGKNYVIVGEEFSHYFGPQIGQNIRLYVPRGAKAQKGGEFAVRLFKIAGKFKTDFYETDRRVVYMSLASGQNFYGLPGGVNKIQVSVADTDKLSQVRTQIDKNIPGFRSEDVKTSQENLLRALQWEKTILSIILFMFVIIAAIGMIAIIYTQVRTKRQSLGILKAIGLSPYSLLVIFTANGLILGVLASLIGGVIGIFMAVNLEASLETLEYGINYVGYFFEGYRWQPVSILPKDVYYFDSLPVSIDMELILIVTLAATVLSGLAGFFPARWASKLEPVETIRHE